MLAPFGIHAKTLRVGKERGNGYEKDAFEDAWARYLPQNRDTVTTRTVEPNLAIQNRDTSGLVTVSENGANPHEQTDVTDVTVPEAAYGAEGLTPYLERYEDHVRRGLITETEMLQLALLDIAYAKAGVEETLR